MSSQTKVILGVCVGLFLLVVVGGGSPVIYGMGEVTKQVEDGLRNNETLVSHLGTIEKDAFRLNWSASIKEDDNNTWIYEVKGSEAAGQVTVKSFSTDWDTEQIIWAKLQLASGKIVELVP